MRLRALLSVLTVGALVFGLLVPLAGSASALQVTYLSRIRVCIVAGTVNVSPGVGRIPPGSNNDGNYTFFQVALVCVGLHSNLTIHDGPPGAEPFAGPEMTGVGTASSSGAFGVGNCGGVDVPLVGSFCGSYSVSGFLIGPGCAGTVGGDEAANTNPANVAASDWSVTFGTSVNGGITCDTMREPLGNVVNAEIGVLALQAAPNPLFMDGEVNGLDPFPGECPAPAPLPQDPGVALVWFCQIIVVGVSVMAALDLHVIV